MDYGEVDVGRNPPCYSTYVCKLIPAYSRLVGFGNVPVFFTQNNFKLNYLKSTLIEIKPYQKQNVNKINEMEYICVFDDKPHVARCYK